jgi:hypothetical protein
MLLHLLEYGSEVGGICLKDLLGGEGVASEGCEEEGEEDGEFHGEE